jgi:Metallo-beta-lactamase superfamily
MYRQGLGDCFLITLPKQDGNLWRMLIDCGVILGTQDVNDRMREAIANIVEDTGGRVDVLVITHEHYDHVAAFAGLKASFCSDTQKRTDGQLQVGEVWFAWTEDPDDPLGQKLSKARAEQVNRLAAMVGQLQSNKGMSPATTRMANGVAELMAFFGLGPEDLAQARANPPRQGMAANGSAGGRQRHLGATAQAMENARALGGQNGEHVRYWKPADPPWVSPDLPGVRIYALGPPHDEAMLKKTFATNEVYHLAASDAGYTAFFGAAALNSDGMANDDSWVPFDNAYGRELRDPQQGGDLRMPDVTAEFLQRHYYGPGSDMAEQDQSWRRIDEDWLGNAAQFALNLDSATNNTSLVLAIELSPGGEVLLFPADAQVGSWLSWQKVEWTLDGNKTVSAPDLLKRTVFYKVGHHGSHNATLRQQGLELMPHGLAAFIPVDHEMAVKKHWDGMPLPGLLTALQERGCAVVRMDKKLPDDPRFRASGKQAQSFAGPLFYEWIMEG